MRCFGSSSLFSLSLCKDLQTELHLRSSDRHEMVKGNISQCISGLSCCCYQIPNKNNLKEEEFGLSYSSEDVVSPGGDGVAAGAGDS